QHHAVCVFVLGLEGGGHGVAAGDGIEESFAFDFNWAATVGPVGPLGNVIVMGAPVGHSASRVFPPVTKTSVAPLRDIRDGGRLSLPKIPVQFRRNRLGLERTLAVTAAYSRNDVLQFADAPVARQ